MGYIMIDIAGTQLSNEDKLLLKNPAVGGLIFFKRNYESPTQITSLVKSIREVRPDSFLIAVDQEGGRVQRFLDGFVRLPSMGSIGTLFEKAPETAEKIAFHVGWVMASELLTCGIDLSFSPVLDLNNPISEIISDRGFHANPQIVILLARQFIAGMRAAGMAAVGKHYPGHGSVKADSHLELPIDERDFATIFATDLQPFVQLCEHECPAIMVAHVLYPKINDLPAGYSPYWLNDILRHKLNYTGAVFSDALDMLGAVSAGDFKSRAITALNAGCDMILMCNNRDATIEVIAALQDYENPEALQRLHKMSANKTLDWDTLHNSPEWQQHLSIINSIG